MNHKKMLLVAYGSSFFIMLVLIVFIYSTSGSTPAVTLPPPAASGMTETPLPGTQANENIKRLTITADNVQSVIRTMSRAESYSEIVTITSYWEDGKAVYKITASVRSGISRLSVSGPKNTSAKNIIITDNNVYIWYGSERSYYTGNAGTKSDPAFLDKFEMIPTYEDVLRIDASDIIEAALTQHNNEPCIYVRARSGEYSYTYEYYVSLATGLLAASRIYDGDTLIYEMSADSVTLTVPSDDAFRLPDGKSAVNS